MSNIFAIHFANIYHSLYDRPVKLAKGVSMKNNIMAAAVLALGFTGAGVFIGQGLVGTRSPLKTVVVKGLAEKKVVSDQGVWTLRYKVVGESLPELYQAIAKSETVIKHFLNNEGFSNPEISTQPQTITDKQSDSYNSNDRAKRFTADGSISVFTTKVDNILSANQHVVNVVKNGVVLTGTETRFRYTKLNDIKPKMLARATVNAKEAANTFAKQSDTKIGAIKSARQGLFTITDANSSYDSGTSLVKKVRVVSTVTFLLK